MAKVSVATQIAQLRQKRAELEKAEKNLIARSHSKALAQIVSIANSVGLTAEEIAAELGKKKAPGRGRKAGAKVAKATKPRGASKLAGQKVAPKYRNPANPEQTWAGRGRAPAWAEALRQAGNLESAAI